MHVSAIIAAGGRGRRLGAAVPKQLLELGGRPMLQWSVEAFLGVPAGDRGGGRRAARVDRLRRPSTCARQRVRLVAGGERRQDSVANGFDAVPTDERRRPRPRRGAAVRGDGDRSSAAIDAARSTGAAIVAVPASDTVKWAPRDGRDASAPAVDRADAAARVDLPGADAAGVPARRAARGRGARPARRRGDRRGGARGAGGASGAARRGRARATSRSRRRRTSSSRRRCCRRNKASTTEHAGGVAIRVGSGYDLHRLVEGRPLILGGVTIPFERGLAGHSDADVSVHAMTDAILGAAALGDIGQHFPDTDARWKDASSLDLLARAVAIVARPRVRRRQRRCDGHRGAAEARAAPSGDRGAPGRALGVAAGRGERQGEDQRRRRRDGPRRGDRRARGRAAAASA